MSLAQIGEFAFVLLSRASNLKLIEVLLYFLSFLIVVSIHHYMLTFNNCVFFLMRNLWSIAQYLFYVLSAFGGGPDFAISSFFEPSLT